MQLTKIKLRNGAEVYDEASVLYINAVMRTHNCSCATAIDLITCKVANTEGCAVESSDEEDQSKA